MAKSGDVFSRLNQKKDLVNRNFSDEDKANLGAAETTAPDHPLESEPTITPPSTSHKPVKPKLGRPSMGEHKRPGFRKKLSPYTLSISLRVDPTDRDLFWDLVESTGATSGGEFFSTLLAHYEKTGPTLDRK